MTCRIYRYEVPVDDQWHRFQLWSEPLAVGCRVADVVEFWALHRDDVLTQEWEFMVVGTGQAVPAGAEYVGTAVTPGQHLLRRRPS